MPRNYDVTIVGAGPAGATLAYELAGKGIKVLVLEKALLPRDKCCAGGLTVKAAKLLKTNLDEIIENKISHVSLFFREGVPFRGNYPETIMYTITRQKFDSWLVNRAEKAGASILQGTAVTGIQFNDAAVDISTTAGNFRSQFVAGADGTSSVVAKEMLIHTKGNTIIGIETEVLTTDAKLAKWKSQIVIDIGRIRAGYAWVFPKTDRLSIGIAGLNKQAKALKRGYQEFVDSLNLGHYTITRWAGGIIPICARNPVVTRYRGLLLGDAAGLRRRR